MSRKLQALNPTRFLSSNYPFTLFTLGSPYENRIVGRRVPLFSRGCAEKACTTKAAKAYIGPKESSLEMRRPAQLPIRIDVRGVLRVVLKLTSSWN